ncbi:tetratricopeptide repeat protein [Chitinophagaceae bacterium MMS25-I14]
MMPKDIVKQKSLFLCILFLSVFFMPGNTALAQSDPLQQAKMYADTKNYDKALELFRKLYDQTPGDADVYSNYLGTLLATKNYKEAEHIVQDQQRIHQMNPLLFIDLGRVYDASGKEKKAEEQYEKAIQYLNGDDLLTTQMATAFSGIEGDKYTIRTFERAQDLLHNPFVYGNQLARLYAKAGDMDKAINALLNAAPAQMGGIEDVKSTLLELLGSDAQKQVMAQKALVKRINAQPDNTYYAELLTWLFTQKGDWDGALIQIEAIDERNKETGQRLLNFAGDALKQSQYEVAEKALKAIIDKGKDQPLFAVARGTLLDVRLQQLQDVPKAKPEDVQQLEKDYEAFLQDFPQYYTTETVRNYAMLAAQYGDDPKKGIALLTNGIGQPNARKDFVGQCKLQLGDYYILDGRVWDASLTYSQVDKAFREDALGEEARFRNAKLAYYRGDFEWAQGQLSVLKASTSELIANDALYLSVLITENIPPDSNLVPLKRYAYADLLLFQNKDTEAEALLDSISKAFPDHPLKDDILMLHAKIAEKHGDYTKALDYLKDVYVKYGQDVLGDDAVFNTAEIYAKKLHQPALAKTFYEKLIIDYPGSTFVQSARRELQAMGQNP